MGISTNWEVEPVFDPPNRTCTTTAMTRARIYKLTSRNSFKRVGGVNFRQTNEMGTLRTRNNRKSYLALHTALHAPRQTGVLYATFSPPLVVAQMAVHPRE